MNSSKFSLTLALACAAHHLSAWRCAPRHKLCPTSPSSTVSMEAVPSTVIQATDGNFYATTVWRW